jgi:hypothetical protein
MIRIRSALRGSNFPRHHGGFHMKVMIGIDPHKASHTAVAIDEHEGELAGLTVRASQTQLDKLLAWAAPFEKRTWAIESAGGLGYLLGQQLLDAGEEVLDVPATLASRVRVLSSGRSDKNDPNDVLSVAVAALRTPALRAVEAVPLQLARPGSLHGPAHGTCRSIARGGPRSAQPTRESRPWHGGLRCVDLWCFVAPSGRARCRLLRQGFGEGR